MEKRKILYIGLIIWLIINLLQSIFMEIHADEAYYNIYGQNLAWGYYDHPPMIGIITYLGSLLFNDNLGIRIITCILQPISLLFIWKTAITKSYTIKDIILFFSICASLPMFVAYGFMTTPDVPLLFFTSLFFYLYNKYCLKPSWFIAILLGLTMGAMLNSKLHGALIILLVLISNIKLLKDIKIWAAGIIALILFMPHIFWQIENGFPSLNYHIIDRSSGFNIAYILEYIPNQLAVFNPLVLGLLIYIYIKEKSPKSDFEKSLWYVMIGMIGFFWLMTLKGHAEPHWTVTASIPAIIVVFRYAKGHEKIKSLALKYISAIAILVLIARIIICTPFLPERIGFSGKEKHYKTISKISKEKPVIFLGSFQGPSLYKFFTNKESTVISRYDSRKTQFDLLALENGYIGKDVYVVDIKKDYQGYFLNNLLVYNHLNIQTALPKTLKHTSNNISDIILSNRYNKEIPIQDLELKILFYQDTCHYFSPVKINTALPETIKAKESIKLNIEFNTDPIPKNSKFKYAICAKDSLGLCTISKFRATKFSNK